MNNPVNTTSSAFRLVLSASRHRLEAALEQRLQQLVGFPPRALVIVDSADRERQLRQAVPKGGALPAVLTWEHLVRQLHPLVDSRVLLSPEEALPFLLRAWWAEKPEFRERLVLPVGLLQGMYRFFELWETFPPAQQQALREENRERLQVLFQVYRRYRELVEAHFVDRFQIARRLPELDPRTHPHWQAVRHVLVEITAPLRPLYREVLNSWQHQGLQVEVFLHVGENPSCFKDMEETLRWATEQAPAPEVVENPFPLAERFLQLEASPLEARHVHLVPLPTRLQEVDWVARKIRQLVVDEAVPLSAIAVTAMDFPRYQPLIENTFREYAIPLDGGTSRILAENPLVEILLTFAENVAAGEPLATIIPLLESPFLQYHQHVTGLDVPELLAELRLPGNVAVLIHQAEQLARYYEAPFHDDDQPPPEMSVAFRTLKTALEALEEDVQQFKQCRTPAEYARFYLNLIEKHAVLQRGVKEVEARNPRQATVNFRALREWIQALDTWQKRQGDIPLTPVECYQALQLLARTHSVTLPRPPRGGVVLVPPEKLPEPSVSVVFVLGMTDANFPRAQHPVLQDIPQHLQSLLAEEAVMRQRRWLANLVENPDQQVFFTYPRREQEAEQIPSTYVQELQRLMPVMEEADSLPVPDPTTWQIFSYTLFAEKQDPPADVPVPVPLRAIHRAVHIWKVQENLSAEPREYEGNLGSVKAVPEILQQRVRERVFSASALEHYARCPMLYFLRYELSIPETQPREDFLTPLERGNLIHTVLYRFYTEVPEDQRSESHLRRIAEEELNRLPLPGNYLWEFLKREFLGGGSQRGIFSEAFDTLSQLDGNFREMGLTEVLAEQPFGFQGDNMPRSWAVFQLATPEGPIQFRGKIDRVNLSADGQFVVIDYKSGTAPSATEIANGLRLQLPLYLMAVQALHDPAQTPLGGGYVEIRRNGNRPALHLLETDGFTRVKDGGQYLTLEEVIQRTRDFIFNYVTEIARGKFPHTPDVKMCATCSFRYLCRRYPPKQQARQRRKNG